LEDSGLFLTWLFPGWDGARHQKGEKEAPVFCTVIDMLADNQQVSKKKMPYAMVHTTGAGRRIPQKCKWNKQEVWMLLQTETSRR